MKCLMHDTDIVEGKACPTCYAGRVELVEQRERTTKVFQFPSGDVVREEASYPRHWWNGDKWVDYAPRWVKTDSGWTLEGMHYACDVPARHIGYTISLFDRSATSVMTEPNLWTEPNAIEQRLFWEFGNLTIYLIPHYDGVSTHYIFRDSLAPRRFVWHQTGDMKWQIGGRDNLNRYRQRAEPDMHRALVVRHERSGTKNVLEWTGQVLAMDEKRRRSYSDDAAYPARMKH